ncbi:MAG: hypothetical protein LBJ73_03060 [Rickettsiales bacterium]|jgi:hypothetical protein|nr:hypothetical protein [Rickettsiales bacterium]
MKKLLILSLLTTFCAPVRADQIDYIINDLLTDTKALCDNMGGTFDADSGCTIDTSKTPTIKGMESRGLSPSDLALVDRFKTLCAGNSGRIENETDIRHGYHGESHTCWFAHLTESNNSGQTNVDKLLKLCDELNKSLGGDQVSWHGRNNPSNAPTEHGCYIFTRYLTDQ